jgi:isoleucyl-tRNA synthetase
VTLSAKANFKKLGKLFGPKMKDAAAHIETFDFDKIEALEKGEKIEVLGISIGMDDIEIRRTKREGVVVETFDDLTVALNTEITKELEDECHAREFVNRVQMLRKSGDFNVIDRIALRCVCETSLQEALLRFKEYICNETLALSLDWTGGAEFGAVETVEINGLKADLQIRVVSKP